MEDMMESSPGSLTWPAREAAETLPQWVNTFAEAAEHLAHVARHLEKVLDGRGTGDQRLTLPPAVSRELIGALQPFRTPGPKVSGEASMDEPTAGPSPRVFQREGDYWTVSYGGTTVRLRDLKGFGYLAHLLARPGREVHAGDLAAATGEVLPSDGVGGASPQSSADNLHVGQEWGDSLLDHEAKAAYRRRLQELEEDIDEASAFCDPERVARAREERDAIVAQLARAMGLGGRDRRTTAAAERNRVNVTRAIRAAIDRVGAAHPVLGRHLSVSVRTGSFCSYAPDPHASGTWVL